jgi:hypothetical protein
MFGFAGLLAHQGGWDELLLVAAPIGIFVLLLKVANARAGHLGTGHGDPPSTPRSDPEGTPPDASER